MVDVIVAGVVILILAAFVAVIVVAITIIILDYQADRALQAKEAELAQQLARVARLHRQLAATPQR